MSRLTHKDFDPAVMQLFDEYVHGRIDRRGFLNGAAKYAVGGVSATMLLEMLAPKFAEAQQVKPDDARIKTKVVEVASPEGSGKIKGLLVTPAKMNGKLPGVLVIHENRGLNPHIEDIARRVALENFVAFAPDALTTAGGYPGDEDKAREAFGKLDQTKIRIDFLAAAAYLKALPECTGKIGAVGFCYGGGIVNMLATKLPDLGGGVPFYGAQPKAEDAAKIKAPMLLQYAATDDFINKGIDAYVATLKEAKVNVESYTYADTLHGFNNDTTPRYKEEAAKLAWGRTIAFFNKNLRS